MYTMFSAGTPDHYYEAWWGHLWVEWKWLAKLPRKPPSAVDLLSPQQLAWAQRAVKNRQPWSLVCGVGTGRDARGFVLSNLKEEISVLISKEQIAAWICLRVGLSGHPLTPSNLPQKSPVA
jgi:hypothetical protein